MVAEACPRFKFGTNGFSCLFFSNAFENRTSPVLSSIVFIEMVGVIPTS